VPKYKLLTTDELHSLEKEFIDYLVVNGIDADTWTKMKELEAEKAEEVVELFSDVVWEGVLRKLEYVEFRSPKQHFEFKCGESEMQLRGLRTDEGSTIDLTQPIEHFGKLMKYVDVVRTSKVYSKKREEELFDMLQNGCEISTGELYKKLIPDN